MPSTFGYMAASGAISIALFFALWWMLLAGGDETPWLPSGLAAGVVMLVAVAAREVVLRRAWARYSLELELRGETTYTRRRPVNHLINVHAAGSALRALLRRLAEIEAAGETSETHLESSRLCEQYLASTDEAMRTPGLATDVRVALRSGQERVRALHKYHVLAWARGTAQRLTHEAQRRARLSDKIETAERALDVIGEALRVCPGEAELLQSAAAVRDLVASVKVAHWVELAERAAFRGRYNRAIARYSDALFFLSRAEMEAAARAEAAERITREIQLLRARLSTGATHERPAKKRKTRTPPPPLPAPDKEEP